MFRPYLKWILAVLLFVLPFAVSDFNLYYVNRSLIYIILAVGLNIAMGYTGFVHLGFAALAGVGAYGTAGLMLQLGFPYLAAVLGGGLIAAAVGLLLAIPAVRLQLLGFALVTFAFGAVAQLIIRQVPFLAAEGMLMFPRASVGPVSLDGNFRLFFVIYPITVALFILFVNIMKSRTGRAFIALADNPAAAQAMGINLHRYGILAFVVSAFYAGIAGGLLAPQLTVLDSGFFGVAETILVVMMLVVGGNGTFVGPVLGAVFLSFLPEFIRSFVQYRLLVYGGIVVLFVIFMPQGIGGQIRIWWDQRTRRVTGT